MTNSRFYSSTAQTTTLNGPVTSSAVSMTVVANYGLPTSFPFTLLLDPGGTEELVDVTAASGTGNVTLAIVRGVDGTTAAPHNSGVTVRHVLTARDATDSRTHEAASADVHGATGINLLSTNDSGFETSVAGWSAGSNTTLAQSAVQAFAGTKSAAMTSTASGDVSMLTATDYAVLPLVSHTYSAWFWSPVTTVGTLELDWRNAAHSFLNFAATTIAIPANQWTPIVLVATSVASTAFVVPIMNMTSTAGAQVFFADTANLRQTGTVVGDTSTQTLTQKTVTAPAISNPAMTGGGSLAGTYTGTPTFSGAAVLSGGPSFTTAAPSVASSLLTGWGGAWTSYTPAWTSNGGTNPVIGNGTLSGKYVQMGKVVHFQAKILMGTTSTFGTLGWQLSLPVAARTGAPDQIFYTQATCGAATAKVYPGQGTQATSTVINLQSPPTSTPFLSLTGTTSAIPGTWQSSSINWMILWGSYEAA